jgi:hypothetical protein
MPNPVSVREAGSHSGKALANFVAHLFAESLPARRPVLLIDVPPIEDVEVFQDRMAIAGHGQDVKELARGPTGTRHFPSADGVGAVAAFKPAKLSHVGRRHWLADRITQILAKLLQFRACHGGWFLIWWRAPRFPRVGIEAAGCSF